MQVNELLSRIEASRMWAYFHKDWLLQIRVSVRQQLPRNYSVFVESETVLISSGGGARGPVLMPDIGITRAEPLGEAARTGRTTAAMIEVEESCELFHQYSLVIRRAPESQLVAALEILSPSNKGVFGDLEKDKFLRKRGHYLEAGVNLLEVDALLHGERVLPPSLREVSSSARIAWSAFHIDGVRRLRAWGWNPHDPLPVIPWDVEEGLQIVVDLPEALEQALRFNPWDSLV